ncbi:Clavaminate synthase-like protein [Zopfia rhizophila CBS 207.26]|uniref:Clavaminate synthase-like protein n=1 Tax=Zopfia rhizophila CBS 207.26 TaxID=1314779 RepID=A0A6A6ETB3_9PEZI|nr:Clavaminate synthase-like protein [Zopfia rhizophila CBS 207.26]
MATITAPLPGRPDISYTPDMAKYLARIKRRHELEKLETCLPEGFPTQLESKLMWEGQSLEESEIHTSHGFKVVRGVPVLKYTREENIIIYASISSHIAPIRGRQDNQYQGRPTDVVLAHIKDLSSVVDTSKISAPAYTTEKQVFHTDIGDVIALFALGEAASGGQSYLSSSWRVYNELASTRPDLIQTLAEPYGKGARPYTLRPLLHHQPATEDIPTITEAQAEALDALHFIAEKYAVSLDFRQGDIQYVNNLSIFHARSGFQDSLEKQRHLKTPAALQDRWDRVYAGLSAENTVFPLEPSVRS